jgi:hypothetical protein
MRTHPPLDATCDACRYWTPTAYSKGICRIGPPTVDLETKTGIWPVTHDIDWCGEWAISPKLVKKQRDG